MKIDTPKTLKDRLIVEIVQLLPAFTEASLVRLFVELKAVLNQQGPPTLRLVRK